MAVKERVYKRDGRAPLPVNEQTSRTMSRIPGRNTKPELLMRKGLWHSGIRGYRLHWKKVPGRPDICFPGRKLAVFVNGCYWHRCPKCNAGLPKSHTDFWKEKFEKNVARDKRKINELHKMGWRTCVVWECELKKDLQQCVERVITAIKASASQELGST